jgi:hypothetical protein
LLQTVPQAAHIIIGNSFMVASVPYFIVTAVWSHLTAWWHCTMNIGKVATVREQLYGGLKTSQYRIYGDMF